MSPSDGASSATRVRARVLEDLDPEPSLVGLVDVRGDTNQSGAPPGLLSQPQATDDAAVGPDPDPAWPSRRPGLATGEPPREVAGRVRDEAGGAATATIALIAACIARRSSVDANGCDDRVIAGGYPEPLVDFRACRSRMPVTPSASVAPDTFRAVMGHFATGRHRRDDARRRPAPGHHRQRADLGQPRAAAGHGRARPPPVHHADRSTPTGRYAVNVLGGPAGAVRLLRRRRGQPGPRGVLRCGLDARPDRPAADRRRDRDARVHGHRDVPGRRPRPVHRPGRLASATPSRTRCRCSTTGAGTCGSSAPRPPARGRARALTDQPRRPRRRALRACACRRSGRTASTSATRRTAPGRRSSCSTARRRSAARTSPRRSRCSRRRSSSTCPMRAATARRAGTRADGFRYDWLVDDLAAFVDALGLETFHLVGLLDGRDDRAPVRDRATRSGCGRSSSSGSRRSASRARRSPGG